MVDVAQLVERLPVEQVVAGSIPVIHPETKSRPLWADFCFLNRSGTERNFRARIAGENDG